MNEHLAQIIEGVKERRVDTLKESLLNNILAFIKQIMTKPLPLRFKMPKIKMYNDGPCWSYGVFKVLMLPHRASGAIMYCAFVAALKITQTWYSRL